jgi:Domain of unknown function (DUF4326)
MSERPQRIQRKRTKGWRKPPSTVCVTRPGKWGNSFKVGEEVTRDSPLWEYIARTLPVGADGFVSLRISDPELAVACYSEWFFDQHLLLPVGELRGKNLACYCPLGAPCHGDWLLEVANRRHEGEDHD